MKFSKASIISLKLVLQTALIIIAVFIIIKDADLIVQGNSESSWTEYAQEFCLLVAIILFAFSAKLYPQARGFLVLVTGFFATMLIREADDLFNQIQHGFWKYPALMVTLLTVLYARKCSGTVKQPLWNFLDSKNFVYITLGLTIVMVFSRIFGSGHFWRHVMADAYLPVYRNIIQEGIELLGYVLVLFGSILVCIEVWHQRAKPEYKQ